jgi:hypothetical protein
MVHIMSAARHVHHRTYIRTAVAAAGSHADGEIVAPAGKLVTAPYTCTTTGSLNVWQQLLLCKLLPRTWDTTRNDTALVLVACERRCCVSP